MKHLSIDQWSLKVEKVAKSFGFIGPYLFASLEYNSFNTGNKYIKYCAYIADLSLTTFQSEDWKEVIEDLKNEFSQKKQN